MSSKHKPRKGEYYSDSDSDDKQHCNISQPTIGGQQPNPPIVSMEHHEQPVVCPTGGSVYPQTNPQMPDNYPTGNTGSVHCNISQPTIGGQQPNPPIVSMEHHEQPVVCPTGGSVYPQTNPQVPDIYPTGNTGSVHCNISQPTIGGQQPNPPIVSMEHHEQPVVCPTGGSVYPVPDNYPTGNTGSVPTNSQVPSFYPTDNIEYPPRSPQAPGMYPSDNIDYPPRSPQAPGMYPSDNIGYPPTNPQLPGCEYPPSGYPQGGMSQSVGFSVEKPNYGFEPNQYCVGQTGQNIYGPNSSYISGMPPPTAQSGGNNFGNYQGGCGNYEPGVPRY